MTIDNENMRDEYTGTNAVDTFTYGFPIFDDDDLVVQVTNTSNTTVTLTKTTDYTVTGVGNSNGTVVLVNSSQAWLDGDGDLLTNYVITIYRDVDITQPSDLKNQGPYFQRTVEDVADRLTMIDQQQQDELDRAITIPTSEDPADYSLTLPAAATRASKYLAFDSAGNATASSVLTTGNLSVSSFVETILDDATNTAVRQTILLDKAGADVASAATINLTTSTGDLIDVTGTTTITAITLAEGVEKTVRFTGALTLTHGASLVLPTGRNITTAAGDTAVFRGYASAVVRCINYQKLTGAPPAPMELPFQARLTLASATPVTAADQSAKTTIYLTPYNGDKLALYNGADWDFYTLAEISIAVPATTSQMYDLFVYITGGTLTLEAVAWTNDTTRATALTRVNGVYVKSGTTTKRYCGSFRTTTASGETADSFATRYLYNYYNRVPRPMRVIEATNSWAYTTATIRQANGAAGNLLDFIVGLDEDPVSARVIHHFSNDNVGVVVSAGIGLDSTTAFTAASGYVSGASPVAAHINALHAHYQAYPGIGRHYLSWLERSVATGTSTHYGDNNALLLQSGIWGEMKG